MSLKVYIKFDVSKVTIQGRIKFIKSTVNTFKIKLIYAFKYCFLFVPSIH